MSKMYRIPIWVVVVSCFLVIQATHSLDEEATTSLQTFLKELSNDNGEPDPSFGWNSSDACNFKGVFCVTRNNLSLELDSFNLSGVFNAASLCSVQSLAANVTYISLRGNSIVGGVSAEIANCTQLTHLLLSGNQFSGSLPDSISMLSNLKQIDISRNEFSGELPDLNRILGLTVFLAQNNRLTGKLPKFHFANLVEFNVSNNNFMDEIPDVNGKFSANSFLGNQELCGDPLPNKCTSKGLSKGKILLYSGYITLGLGVLAFILCRLSRRKKSHEKVESANKVASVDDDVADYSATASSENKTGMSRSEILANSTESTTVSSSLTVLTSPVVNGLRFEDLLRAPAELLGRGKHSTLYKVMLENRIVLTVKRIKDWPISGNELKQRMQRIDQARHPNVLPVLAYYCSKEEKLLVYEYQQNGSLFKLLHGNQRSQSLDWSSRLGVAARISQALAYMHRELQSYGIAHGNLKSTNILLNNNMEPCLGEYGLTTVENQGSIPFPKETGQHTQNKAYPSTAAFTADIYGLGVILLELLTGKLVQNGGVDLATWVQSAVREEWTVEVFDKSLISEGASEERMVNLLQVAIKCVNRNPAARPSINQVTTMVNSLKEEDDRSLTYDPSVSFTSSMMTPA